MPSSSREIHTRIAALLESSSDLHEPAFKFEVSEEASEYNMSLLKKNNFDLAKLLNAQPSITSYGSEFKKIPELESLLGRHPRWDKMKKRLEEGACFPIEEVDKETRKEDLKAMKDHGNHKSAIQHEEFLATAFEKEVKKGWILLLPDKDLESIPNLELAPMGVADQLGISATGYFVSKQSNS